MNKIIWAEPKVEMKIDLTQGNFYFNEIAVSFDELWDTVTLKGLLLFKEKEARFSEEERKLKIEINDLKNEVFNLKYVIKSFNRIKEEKI